MDRLYLEKALSPRIHLDLLSQNFLLFPFRTQSTAAAFTPDVDTKVEAKPYSQIPVPRGNYVSH